MTSSEEARSQPSPGSLAAAAPTPATDLPRLTPVTVLASEQGLPPLPPGTALGGLGPPPACFDNVYESAAKILFLAVKWARSIPAFLQVGARGVPSVKCTAGDICTTACIVCLQLSGADQSVLLEEGWPDLFVLSAAQWQLPVHHGKYDTKPDSRGTPRLAPSPRTLASHPRATADSALSTESLVAGAVSPPSRRSALAEDARRLEEAVARFIVLRVDHTEYACLKALVLFKAGEYSILCVQSNSAALFRSSSISPGWGSHFAEARGLSDGLQVEALADQTHAMMSEYCSVRGRARLGRLLLLLPAVRALSSRSLQELFFRQTVGDVPIERLLGDMLNSP